MKTKIKTEIEKINKGCGKEVIDKIYCGDKTGIYSQLWLCPSCKSKKQGLIQGAKMMIEEIESQVENFSFTADKEDNILIKRDLLSELKQLNNWLEKE